MNHRKMGLYKGRINNIFAIPKRCFLVFPESSSVEAFRNSFSISHHPARPYKWRALDIQGYFPI